MSGATTRPASVFAQLVASAEVYGDRPFLCVTADTASAYGIAPGETSYRDIAVAARALAVEYAQAGVGEGDRVGLLLENRPDFFRHWFALNARGASVVPINPDLKADELAYLVGHSEMIAAIVLPHRQDDIRSASRAAGRDIPIFAPDERLGAIGRAGSSDVAPEESRECALLYTSGTTGRPKGCVLSNTYYLNSGQWYLKAGGLIALRLGCERMLTPLPLFHMNAMATSTMAMMMSGGCLIPLDRFHPKTWWANVRASRATIVHYLGVIPPILMAAEPTAEDRAHHVRFGFGAGVDKRLHAAFEARFGFPLIEAWGMTETGGGVVISDNHEGRRVGLACFGRPDAQSEIRLLRDDGGEAGIDEPAELLVRRSGPDPRAGFFTAYLKDPAATEEAWKDGWFHTGDIVKRDAQGYLYFVDRKKNVIRRAGENIAAVEVEALLMQLPNVRAAGVAAVPDDVRGEEVFACIVADEAAGDAANIATDIVKDCLARAAYYKAPGYIAFVPELPLTATQKIQRGALKTLVADLLASGKAFDLRHLKKRSA